MITGSPGSGKTTLAAALQRELHYPLLRRDTLKEVLLDHLGDADRPASRRLGAASWSLLWEMLWEMLEQLAGRVPVIVESNFSRGRDETNLAPRLALSSPVMLHCETDPETLRARVAERKGSTDRHPGHFDDIAWLEVERRLADGGYEPLDLPFPTLRIDTTAGLNPNLEAILEYIRSDESGCIPEPY